MTWQPIETAPKDGTAVDVWATGYSDEPGRIVDARNYGDGWWMFHDFGEGDAWRIDDSAGATVTHWMPLPEPPNGD